MAAHSAVAGAQSPASARSASLTRPSGWLGIHYSAEARIEQAGPGLTISYNSYPVIEAIEPGSPAERSGLQVGDTLLSFNDHDFVRRGVPMAKLLRPGEKLAIRVKRNKHRTVNVTVSERPPGPFAFRMTMTPAPGRYVTVRSRQRSGTAERERSTAELREVGAALAPLIAFLAPSGAMSIAGAEMVPVNPQLGEVLGVRKGVLLVNVPRATPASRSGLRAGDVVVKAATAEIVDPAGLHMAMIHAGPGRSLRLDVVRKGKPQRVILRW